MSPAERVRLEIPAAYAYFASIGALIEALLTGAWAGPWDADSIYQVQLAVHEVCNNIVQHAYGHENGTIKVEFRWESTAGRLEIDLRDCGRSFDLTRIERPDISEPRDHGYGLFLIYSLMDEVVYESQNDFNVWRLSKLIPTIAG